MGSPDKDWTPYASCCFKNVFTLRNCKSRRAIMVFKAVADRLEGGKNSLKHSSCAGHE